MRTLILIIGLFLASLLASCESAMFPSLEVHNRCADGYLTIIELNSSEVISSGQFMFGMSKELDLGSGRFDVRLVIDNIDDPSKTDRHMIINIISTYDFYTVTFK